MKKENVKYSVLCAGSLALFVWLAVYAAANVATDVIMPSICFSNGMTTWYVMLLSVLAEAVVIKGFLKESYFKTAAMSMVMNLISTALGFVTLFLVGLIVELILIPFGCATFHISHWIATFLMVILMNACIEGLIVRIGFKLKFKKTFACLCWANAISIAICFLFHLSWIAEMYV